MSKTITAAALYTQYVAAAKAAGVAPKSLKSFKNKDAINEAIAAFKPSRGNVVLSGKTQVITVSLTKVQRALGRRWCERFGIERPERWVGSAMPVEMIEAMGL